MAAPAQPKKRRVETPLQRALSPDAWALVGEHLMMEDMDSEERCEWMCRLAGGSKIRTTEDGCTYLNYELHSFDDKPACVTEDGTREWWWKGAQHRPNGKPASIRRDGTCMWYDEDGELHRDNDLPAIVWGNGQEEWFTHGERRREGNKPIVKFVNGEYGYCDGYTFYRERPVVHPLGHIHMVRFYWDPPEIGEPVQDRVGLARNAVPSYFKVECPVS